MCHRDPEKMLGQHPAASAVTRVERDATSAAVNPLGGLGHRGLLVLEDADDLLDRQVLGLGQELPHEHDGERAKPAKTTMTPARLMASWAEPWALLCCHRLPRGFAQRFFPDKLKMNIQTPRAGRANPGAPGRRVSNAQARRFLSAGL